MVDGLIIPRSYNDYFSRSDPAAIRQLVAQFTDAALSATSENPVQNKVVKAALDVINAVIPAGASANDKLALKSSVDAIDAKIPTQVSAQNQLADKDFVNSSVSTNTANYISDNGDPFTSVAALEAYSGTVTNNDYAFVTGTDADGNVYYDRYKATVSGASVSWAKEYRLNNSSFTAAQWAAISSGITAAKVEQYDAGVTPVNVVEKGNTKAVSSAAVYTAYKDWTEWFTLIPKFALTTGTNQKTLSYNRKISDYLFILFTLGNGDLNTRETMLIPATQLVAKATAYGFCYVGGVLKEADITITSDTTISVTGDVGLYLGMYGVIKKLA